jgi:hypothetical protein
MLLETYTESAANHEAAETKSFRDKGHPIGLSGSFLGNMCPIMLGRADPSDFFMVVSESIDIATDNMQSRSPGKWKLGINSKGGALMLEDELLEFQTA